MSNTPISIGWNSRLTFILAAAGSAIGLGNIWKFPYITGENGGGAFVFIYLICIAMIGLPVLMAEILIGRSARRNPVNATLQLARKSDLSKAWMLIGILGAITGLLVMSFYSVVAGWVMHYIIESASGNLNSISASAATQHFKEALHLNKELQLGWHTAFTLLTVAVVAAGVKNGLGNAARFLMPVLFLLLITLLIYSMNVGDFKQAVDFLFIPDFSKLNSQSVIKALGHAFFTLSIGMGTMMAYGAYMPANASIAKTAIAIVALDTLVALIAGAAIFPLVFAHGITPGAGPELIFISLPIAFGDMPFGQVFGCLFFVLILIAAWTSSISLIEPAVAWLCENTRLSRLLSTGIIGLIVWLGGVMCIYIDGVFGALDYTSSNILLPLGGLLVAIFVGWKIKRKIAKTELSDLGYNTFNLWYATLRVFSPIGILLVFAFSIGLI